MPSQAFPERVLDCLGLAHKAWRKLPPADQARLFGTARDLDDEHGTCFAPA